MAAGTFGVGLVHDAGQTVGAAVGNTVSERARAVRAVASMSDSVEECAVLLAMLGLTVQDALSSERAS